MRFALRFCLVAIFLVGLSANAQTPSANTPQTNVASGTSAAAAKVNGQAVPEAAVQRALTDVPPQRRTEARIEIVNQFIDNVLVEQYLLQMRVDVPDQAVDKRLTEMKTEAKKFNKDFDAELKKRQLGMEELRGYVKADLRWEAFAATQMDDAKLKSYFDGNKSMFDGSAVRARHILVTMPTDDPKSNSEAVAKLQKIKQEIEAETAAGLAKLPSSADKLAREKARESLIEDSFSAHAKKESACPSKEHGGDVGWFSRAGAMVESFSRAAYACKPYEITEPVKTQFGYHLILVTAQKPGREPKFDDVKLDVKRIYDDKLRESVVIMMRQRSKIEITPVKP